MKSNLLSELSGEMETLVKKTAGRLVHIGGEDVPYRTGVLWDGRRLLTTAVSAREGEEVSFLETGGAAGKARVCAFDSLTGLALLEREGAGEAPAWEGAEPLVGGLAVTVAYPSPAGPEARLDMIRCVGDDYFQTDGDSFPGFSGAAVVTPAGKLLGIVTSNARGNRGQALPYKALADLVSRLDQHGSRRRRVLGVRTQATAEGLLVVETAEGSAARTAGLLVGDILRQLDDFDLRDPFDLVGALDKSTGKINLTIMRGGKETSLSAEPQEEVETAVRQWKHGSCCR